MFSSQTHHLRLPTSAQSSRCISQSPLLSLSPLVPALSASVQARDGSVGYNGYSDGGSREYGKDYGHNDGGSKDFGKKDDDKDHGRNDGGSKDFGKDNDDKDHGRKDCTWEPVFEHKKDFRGWNKGKYTHYDHNGCQEDTYEIDCKSLCEKDDKCNSCRVYSEEEIEEKIICELFENTIDILTWEDNCDEDKDDKKYYDSSCWNVHYNY
ncbi:uncharacterized protein EV420DRAFT_1539753 [Desarmillaria tabescens]|uniref:Uncharacterized protein n=1 Tax=Armillaria tabescens TaxID=1929756 RepID=A0AA39KGK6_ARMTA|nr:uncharacterized protein EV420DRAFT_1539753 [Desarmillaria tabescens]KAK0459354.1 hypothetical protein EV420DRAFT_1539753 [Desarmillaria tabescens]